LRSYSFGLNGFAGISMINSWFTLFQEKSLGYALFYSSKYLFSPIKFISSSNVVKDKIL
jgi:hypothetical protein